MPVGENVRRRFDQDPSPLSFSVYTYFLPWRTTTVPLANPQRLDMVKSVSTQELSSQELAEFRESETVTRTSILYNNDI